MSSPIHPRPRRLQTLPFIVGVNPYVNDVYHMYWDAFRPHGVRQEDSPQSCPNFVNLVLGSKIRPPMSGILCFNVSNVLFFLF